MSIKINTDIELVKIIREKLKENDNYCPCSLVKNKDTKCMCKNFIEQDKSGWCHCRLYYKDMEANE